MFSNMLIYCVCSAAVHLSHPLLCIGKQLLFCQVCSIALFLFLCCLLFFCLVVLLCCCYYCCFSWFAIVLPVIVVLCSSCSLYCSYCFGCGLCFVLVACASLRQILLLYYYHYCEVLFAWPFCDTRQIRTTQNVKQSEE